MESPLEQRQRQRVAPQASSSAYSVRASGSWFSVHAPRSALIQRLPLRSCCDVGSSPYVELVGGVGVEINLWKKPFEDS